ncbi:MAG TPA: glucose 1-dehydrogenase [Rariglobus sp.]|jgi:3-oxoacyl-[acyl-carrier protein] reductase|nr:glucose 1-dehydrogenase [Rariglobus sp.]
MSSSQKLAGKVALVTGASKGIGASIAKHLAAAGASVVVNYASSKAGSDKVVAEITAAGGQAVAIQADVSKPDDIARLIAATKSVFGGLDILVNNAGIYEFRPLEEITVDHYRRLFDLNVLGLTLTTQAAVKLFPATGGVVINISSGASIVAPATASLYSATKAAVDAISRSLAQELGPRNIRVNSLNPGMIETEGVHTAGFLGTDFHKQIIAQTPLGRIGQPDDIGKVAVFLASDDSAWITKQAIQASGGHV